MLFPISLFHNCRIRVHGLAKWRRFAAMVGRGVASHVSCVAGTVSGECVCCALGRKPTQFLKAHTLLDGSRCESGARPVLRCVRVFFTVKGCKSEPSRVLFSETSGELLSADPEICFSSWCPSCRHIQISILIGTDYQQKLKIANRCVYQTND